MTVPWLRVALDELGVAELPDPQENPRILAYFAKGAPGFFAVDGDETNWCAAYVGWALETAGIESTRKPNARSYLGWGLISPPRIGAVTILWRGSRDAWTGHVGFLLGYNDASIILLGGNQSNTVSVAPFSHGRVLGYRWPKSAVQGST